MSLNFKCPEHGPQRTMADLKSNQVNISFVWKFMTLLNFELPPAQQSLSGLHRTRIQDTLPKPVCSPLSGMTVCSVLEAAKGPKDRQRQEED